MIIILQDFNECCFCIYMLFQNNMLMKGKLEELKSKALMPNHKRLSIIKKKV